MSSPRITDTIPQKIPPLLAFAWRPLYPISHFPVNPPEVIKIATVVPKVARRPKRRGWKGINGTGMKNFAKPDPHVCTRHVEFHFWDRIADSARGHEACSNVRSTRSCFFPSSILSPGQRRRERARARVCVCLSRAFTRMVSLPGSVNVAAVCTANSASRRAFLPLESRMSIRAACLSTERESRGILGLPRDRKHTWPCNTRVRLRRTLWLTFEFPVLSMRWLTYFSLARLVLRETPASCTICRFLVELGTRMELLCICKLSFECLK